MVTYLMNGKLVHKIHDFQMNISYDQNHRLYQYLSKYTKQNNIMFDNNLTICSNIYDRVDYTLQLIQNKRFSEYIRTCMEGVDTSITYEDSLHRLMSDNIINKIQGTNFLSCIKILMTRFRDSHNRIGFIFHCIDLVREKINTPSEISAIYYFLGLHESFHLMIANILYKMIAKQDHHIKLILGEQILINPLELLTLDINEMAEYFTNEYDSHSVLFIISGNNMYYYDSDLCKTAIRTRMEGLDRIKNVFDCNTVHLFDVGTPEQESFDDSYCIFYCIRMIITITQSRVFSNLNLNDMKQLMIIVKENNRLSNSNDIIKFAYNMALKVENNL